MGARLLQVGGDVVRVERRDDLAGDPPQLAQHDRPGSEAAVVSMHDVVAATRRRRAHVVERDEPHVMGRERAPVLRTFGHRWIG